VAGLIRSFPLHRSLLLGQRSDRLWRPVAIAVAFKQFVGPAPVPVELQNMTGWGEVDEDSCRLRLATGLPSRVCRMSGSRPRLPTRIILFTLLAMMLSCLAIGGLDAIALSS